MYFLKWNTFEYMFIWQSLPFWRCQICGHAVESRTATTTFIRGFCGCTLHGDVIKWKHYPPNWPFVRGIHRSPVNSLHKGQWRGAWMFSSICAWINGWVNNREAGDLRRHRTHYDVTVIYQENTLWHRNNTLNLLRNKHNRHPIVSPRGGDNGCLLCVQVWSKFYLCNYSPVDNSM